MKIFLFSGSLEATVYKLLYPFLSETNSNIDALSNEEGSCWQFVLTRPTTEHLLAVAVRAAGKPDISIIQHFIVP